MRKILKYLYVLALLIAIVSCSSPQSKTEDNAIKHELRYARGFSVKQYEDYKVVTVRDPWDTIHSLYKYILIDINKKTPDNLPEGTIVKVPLQTVIAFSTIQCSMIQEIGEQDRITGVCQAEYIDLPYIQEQLKAGKILNLGSMHKPDVEQLINLMPSALVVSAMETGMGYLDKLNIPVIATTDYMEDTALGRAEWIYFHSLFYGKELYADSLFKETERRYNAIKDKVKNEPNKPTVFNDLKFGKTWRIAGGKSYLANLIKDAGGEYVWDDDNSTGSSRLSAEIVLDKAETADIWLLKYNRDKDFTYDGLANEDNIYTQFDAFRHQRIWGCNTSNNDYFEDLPIHPDTILKDMASIFYPHLFSENKLNYEVVLTNLN